MRPSLGIIVLSTILPAAVLAQGAPLPWQQQQQTYRAQQWDNGWNHGWDDDHEDFREHRRDRPNRRYYQRRSDRVDCEVSGGNAKFRKGFSSDWYGIVPARFSLNEGEAQDVTLRRMGKERMTTSVWAGYDDYSRELEFCADENTDKRYKRCRRIPVRLNISEPLSIPGALDGSSIRCAVRR